MLSCTARALARLEQDALGLSIRVTFDDRIFVACLVLVVLPCSVCCYCSHYHIAPPGCYSIHSVLSGLNSLPAIVLGTSTAILPWPLPLPYHVCISGFRSYVWFPPRHPLGVASYSRLSISIVSIMIR